MPPNLSMDLINDYRLYMIGAGILHINLWDPVTGQPTGYYDMGNATVVNPVNSDTRLVKNESRTRYRARVADILLQRNTDISINLDEWSRTALGIYFQGTVSDQPAQLATPIVAEVITTAAIRGRSYRLAKRGPISAVSGDNSTTTTPLVEGDDFIIDDVNVPVIRLLPDAPNIADGDTVTFDYTPTAYTGSTGIQIDIGQIPTVQASMSLIGDPPNGPRLLFDWWKVTIRPNGELPLINTTNDNTPIPLIASVQSDPVNHPDNPIGRILQLPA